MPKQFGAAMNPETMPLPTSPIQVMLILTALTVIPALLMSVTPFLRITIALHFLRQALGTQTAPSNQVLLGLALVMTLILIQPISGKIEQSAITPFVSGKLTGMEAWKASEPIAKTYLLGFCREKDLALFAQASGIKSVATPSALPISVVASAYMLSELRAGFQIGAAIFLPFLVVDLVVASVTLALGMVQLPPVMIAAPLKVLLFVAVDGWNLLIGSLLRSFQQ
jgi:flagellar biosynthesis protein FliP